MHSGSSGRGGGSQGGGGYSRSREAHAPAHPPKIVVTPVPRQSMFRDAAAIAGGVTVGTAAGNVVGSAITGLFSGPRREEVVQALPRDYRQDEGPTGPCAYEVAQFLQCAANREQLEECAAFNDALKDCKRRNRIP